MFLPDLIENCFGHLYFFKAPTFKKGEELSIQMVGALKKRGAEAPRMY
jgi:hypothetical protein